MIEFVLDLEEYTIYVWKLEENDNRTLLETMGVSFNIEIENGLGNRELLFACQRWLDEKEMFNIEYRVFIRTH
jgi:hypothetical protein